MASHNGGNTVSIYYNICRNTCCIYSSTLKLRSDIQYSLLIPGFHHLRLAATFDKHLLSSSSLFPSDYYMLFFSILSREIGNLLQSHGNKFICFTKLLFQRSPIRHKTGRSPENNSNNCFIFLFCRSNQTCSG